MDKIKSESVSIYGSTGTSIQWLWGKDDGAPNFALRKFILEPGGNIGLHSHREEHEIYILSGNGIVFDDSGNEFFIKETDTLFVPPNEVHGYTNTGKEDLHFLCIIPLL
ncbi:MAG: cupin domain-containing protein [Candidatus Heimdallarchaeota archaeon]|nr:cupin domain-containing protein [Candidatus Heimdallarchaeota archaeon]